MQVSESLHVEQEENKRLNTYLDQILKEIQVKAPIMKKQREDYEKVTADCQSTDLTIGHRNARTDNLIFFLINTIM